MRLAGLEDGLDEGLEPPGVAVDLKIYISLVIQITGCRIIDC